MKTLKVLSIIGIVICGLGILGSLMLIADNDDSGALGVMIYGYFLAYSIFAIKATNGK